MKKRFIATILTTVMIILNGTIGISPVKAELEKNKYIEFSTSDKISSIKVETLNDIEAVVISDNVKNHDKDELNELMDNGTGIIVTTNDVEEIMEYFDIEVSATSDNELGCYVYKDANETKIIPMECSILVEEGTNEEVSQDDIKSLMCDTEIDYDYVIENYNTLRKVDKLDKLDKDVLASLQGSTSIGSAFMDNDKFVYFYKKGINGGTGTEYKYSSSSGIDGWTIMGSLSFSIYAIKIKTDGNVTYDNVMATTVATAYKDRWVTEFRNGISVSDPDKNKIIDYTECDGNANTSNTGTIGIEVDDSGEVTAKCETSYTYNPYGMEITTTLFSNRVRWICDPCSNKGNASWKINPGIVLKCKNGKNQSVTATSYVSYFQIKGTWRSYTIDDTISCSIKFKNHTKVS